MQLTKNFTREEFACKCGCGFNTVDYEMVFLLQDLRDYWDKPVTITSGCRCEKHNVKVGGHYNSGHLRAEAIDFYVKDISPTKIHNWIDSKYPDRYKLGNGKDFTHWGLGTKARWIY